MGTRVIWTKRAEARLLPIYNYIAKDNKKAANEIVKKIYASAKTLEIYPQAGSIEILLADLPQKFRSLVVKPHYKLIYLIDNKKVYIISVWDTRKDPETLRFSI